MIGVVLVLTAVGGLVARSIYQPGSNASAAPPTAAPPPSTDVPTSGTPGSIQVKMSLDAAQSPYGGSVLNLLQAYYGAINVGSYTAWMNTVTPNLIATLPEPTWDSNYKSTSDTGMYVYRINAAPSSQLRVLITFTSHQSLAKAPNFAKFTCINWQSILTLTMTKLGWKVDSGTAGGHPITAECASS